MEAPTPSRGRVVTAGAVATAPVVLGILLWWISQPYPESLEGARGLFAPMEVDLFFTATVAFAWAAVSATLSSTLIFRARMRSVLGADFGRVLPLAVVPFTGVVFALILEFLLLGLFDGQLTTGANSIDITQVDATASAFTAFGVALAAFPVAAWVSNHVRRLSPADYPRALVVMVAGELPALFGLVRVFLALGSLSAH